MQVQARECCIDGEKSVALTFPYNFKTKSLIKQIEKCRWSAPNKFWYIPYRRNYLTILNEKFLGKITFIEITPENRTQSRTSMIHFPSAYIETLKLKNYSEPTIKTYRQHFHRFLVYLSGNEPERISNEQIRDFMLYLVNEKKYSVSSQNQAINSIKFYYHEVLNRKIDDYYLPRPKKEKKLPIILNETEVSKILKCIKNLRYRCMIFLIYSAGLTPSEIKYLKPEHIDSKNMKIFISSVKGDKDRFVILSSKVLIILREYYQIYHPVKWLFEKTGGVQCSKRNLQKAFQSAVKISKISKPATLTILRNSFAVHLIEKGVDIRYIQQIFGHKNSKTTMKYLKVSKRDLSVIQSPLDNLDV